MNPFVLGRLLLPLLLMFLLFAIGLLLLEVVIVAEGLEDDG